MSKQLMDLFTGNYVGNSSHEAISALENFDFTKLKESRINSLLGIDDSKNSVIDSLKNDTIIETRYYGFLNQVRNGISPYQFFLAQLIDKNNTPPPPNAYLAYKRLLKCWEKQPGSKDAINSFASKNEVPDKRI